MPRYFIFLSILFLFVGCVEIPVSKREKTDRENIALFVRKHFFEDYLSWQRTHLSGVDMQKEYHYPLNGITANRHKAVIWALNDPDVRVRRAAAWCSYAFNFTKESIPTLIDAMDDEDQEVRRWAACGLRFWKWCEKRPAHVQSRISTIMKERGKH